MADDRRDPFRVFNFRLEIDGVPVAAFSEVGGLQSDGDVADYRTGMDIPLTNRRLPGLRKFGPITLKRGLTGVKPERVCQWLFEVMGCDRDDTLVDLFPGSSAVGRAWEAWRAQRTIFEGAA